MQKARTTVVLDARLLKQAKRLAVEQDTTLSGVIERALQLWLKAHAQSKEQDLSKLFALADRHQLRSVDGPLARDEAHER